ncbi:hypothetical protein PG988_012652, partial [Apiospora saccharicola]
QNARKRSYNWGIEIFALLFSVSALAALIVLLLREDNKPLNSWIAPFSLNTIVSVLSVAFRTPLAFAVGSCLGQGKWAWFSKRSGSVAVFAAIDEASRGPLGSLGLIWRLKARHWVSFGALVTIALIAADPFLQAIINYEGRLVSENGTDAAQFALASHLNIGSLVPTTDVLYNKVSGILKCYDSKPNLAMSTSSILGFVNSSTSNSAKPPLVTCPTGNCTWEAHSTLAVCSSCYDVTTKLKKERHPKSRMNCGRYGNQTLDITKYAIPWGIDDVWYQGKDGIGDGTRSTRGSICGYSTVGNTTVAGGWMPNPSFTYNMQTWDTLLAAFVLLKPTDSYYNKELAWESDVMSATECGLGLCLKVFQPNVTNGETYEILTSDKYERVDESFQPKTQNSTVAAWIRHDFGVQLGSRWLKDSLSCPAIVERSNLELRIPEGVQLPNEVQRNFSIQQASIQTIIDDMTSREQMIYDALNDTTNITKSFENAARLMSYQIRELDGSTRNGIVQKWTIFIQIRWKFMILPVLISFLGLVFSIRTMLESHRLHVQIMKAKMLESLLHGLDEGTGAQLRNSKVKHKMEKHVFVRLRGGKDGLRLRQPGADHHDDTETTYSTHIA